MCWCFDLHNRPLKPPYICILAPFPLHRTAVESLATNVSVTAASRPTRSCVLSWQAMAACVTRAPANKHAGHAWTVLHFATCFIACGFFFPQKPPPLQRCHNASLSFLRSCKLTETLQWQQRLNTEVTIEDVYITSRNLNPSAALAHYLASTSSALVDPKLAAFA